MRFVRVDGIFAVREDVVAADRRIATVQDVALPFAEERTLRRAALVARVYVYRATSVRRPSHDLDLALRRIVHEMSVAFQRLGRRVDDGHPHPRELRRQVRVEVIDDGRHGDSATILHNFETDLFPTPAPCPMILSARTLSPI